MKKWLIAAAIVACGNTSAFAADIGVSVNIGQPGFYGRIDIGNAPTPRLIAPRPVIIERVPVNVVQEPLYLHVPPGHAKNWRKHCRQYDACGRQVYFVDDRWYNDVYVPHYREHHGDRFHEERHEEHRDRDEDGDRHDHGHGKDKNRGHGRGNDHDRD